MSDLRYPVGPFNPNAALDAGQRQACIDAIAAAPGLLCQAVAGLNDAQLDTPYRPDGWTVRQVVHHLADSHVNGYTRFKLALTEQMPAIKTYDEKRWAELDDARGAPIEVSLALLDALHQRWARSLRAMKVEDFNRKVRHPERGELDLDFHLQLYAWHGRHHTAHISGLRERSGWK